MVYLKSLTAFVWDGSPLSPQYLDDAKLFLSINHFMVTVHPWNKDVIMTL